MGETGWCFTPLLSWRKGNDEEWTCLHCSFPHWMQCREMPPQFSHHNKGFINYVFCRNWAVRNPAGTRLDSSLVNKQVEYSLVPLLHCPTSPLSYCHLSHLSLCPIVTRPFVSLCNCPMSLYPCVPLSLCPCICLILFPFVRLSINPFILCLSVP